MKAADVMLDGDVFCRSWVCQENCDLGREVSLRLHQRTGREFEVGAVRLQLFWEHLVVHFQLTPYNKLSIRGRPGCRLP